MQDDVGGAVRQLQHLDDVGDCAVTIQVLLHGILDLTVILAENGNRTVPFLCLLDQAHRLFTPHRHRHCHRGKQHHVAQWQNGDILGFIVLNVSAVGYFMYFGDDRNDMGVAVTHLAVYII